MALTAEQIEEFLDKLNSDEDFRKKLVDNSASVLEEYGIPYEPEDLVDPSEVKLPEPGEVNENREAFRETLFPDDAFQRHQPNFTLPTAKK